MIVIPAFSLADRDAADPPVSAAVLGDWEWTGFRRAQLDFGAAGFGSAHGRPQWEDLLREGRPEIQVSGSIGTSDEIDALIAAGASTVVLGDRALDEPDWLTTAADSFPGHLLVRSTARERRIRTRGSLRTRPVDLRDLVADYAGLPLAGVVVTYPPDAIVDIPDLGLLEDLAEEGLPILVEGGAIDLAALRDLEFRGVAGVIIDASRIRSDFDDRHLARSFPE